MERRFPYRINLTTPSTGFLGRGEGVSAGSPRENNCGQVMRLLNPKDTLQARAGQIRPGTGRPSTMLTKSKVVTSE